MLAIKKIKGMAMLNYSDIKCYTSITRNKNLVYLECLIVVLLDQTVYDLTRLIVLSNEILTINLVKS